MPPVAAGFQKGERMFKKAILGVAIVGVLAAVGVTVAAATSSPAEASKHRVQTIQLIAKQTGSSLLVLAAHGPVGNQFLSTDDLYRHGRKVGDDATVCQFMADLGQAGGRFQCLATLALPEGQLTAQGLATLTEAGGQPVTLAITGGTGAYRTAHGQARIIQVSETEARYTLTVIT
jgi:hypothetical protein